MSRKSLSFAILLAATTIQVANASDGTINFNGELVTQTCTIAVDGVVTPTAATVTLPTVSTSVLSTSGEVAGQTGFNIQLSACTGAATTAAAFFEAGASVDPVSGNLNNMTGTASEVQLQLIDAANGSAIQAGNTNQITNTTRNTLVGGAVNMPYAVQYFATAATTPGTVISSVTYSIDYQ
ncbi:fimbrial protein [Pseudomonas sp. PHC1]|uniref:fimbrial protein n=1 Tax=Pseudomonas sp. PHC1 TaxID=3384759 RepID=UPI00396F4868